MKDFLLIRDARKIKEALEPSRQKILELLSIKEMDVKEIAAILEKDVSTIYRHISKLEDSGLVEKAREERVGPVSRRYYGRVARNIVMLLPSEETHEADIFRRTVYEKMRKGLLALKGFRYNIPDDNASVDKLTKIATEWDRLWIGLLNKRIDEEKMVGDILAYRVALKLLCVVEPRESPQLRKATELLASELAKYRRKI